MIRWAGLTGAFALAVLLWWEWPRLALWSAALDQTAESGEVKSTATAAEARAAEQLEFFEQRFGATALSCSVRGRLALHAGMWDEAIRQFHLAQLLGADEADPAMALGARGVAENRAIDTVAALEILLRLADHARLSSDRWAQAARFAGAIPAPEAEARFWGLAGRPAEESAARSRIDARHRRIEKVLTQRRADTAIAGSDELLLQKALTEWIDSRQQHEDDLAALAKSFEKEHQDRYLSDLVEGPGSAGAERALAAAARANQTGQYEEGERAARQAGADYRKVHNRAGVVAAGLEQIYGQWRSSQNASCDASWMQTARQQDYKWAVLRGRFEELSCRTVARHYDVLAEREVLAREAARAGYAGLALRTLAAVTEPYHSQATPAEAWQRGHDGLERFWTGPFPATAASNFYLSLGHAAETAGWGRVAVLLLREAESILAEHPNRQLREVVRGSLAGMRARTGDPERDLSPSPLARAAGAMDRGQPQRALVETDRVTGGPTRFPYPDIDYYDRVRLLPLLARAYQATGRNGEARRHFTLAIEESERRVASVKDPQQRDALIQEAADGWRAAVEIEATAGSAQSALNIWQRFRNIRREEEWKSPGVRPDEAWFTVARVRGGWVAWLLRSDGVRMRRINNADLETRASRFSSLAATEAAPVQTIERAGEALAVSLWGDLRGAAEQATLLIVDVEGELALIPWAALPRKDGHPLGSRTAVVQTLGWAEARRRGGRVRPPALVVSDPAVGLAAHLPVLTEAAWEAGMFRARFPQTNVLSGPAATVRAVRAEIENVRIFHFIGHGLVNGGAGALLLANPENSGTSLLDAATISQLKLGKLDLCVLASCSSGIGRFPGALNLESLVQSFLAAGAARVVGSRWDVASPDAARLMEVFYRSVADGVEPAEALRRGSEDVRSRSKHPYHWAVFQLFGAP